MWTLLMIVFIPGELLGGLVKLDPVHSISFIRVCTVCLHPSSRAVHSLNVERLYS